MASAAVAQQSLVPDATPGTVDTTKSVKKKPATTVSRKRSAATSTLGEKKSKKKVSGDIVADDKFDGDSNVQSTTRKMESASRAETTKEEPRISRPKAVSSRKKQQQQQQQQSDNQADGMNITDADNNISGRTPKVTIVDVAGTKSARSREAAAATKRRKTPAVRARLSAVNNGNDVETGSDAKTNIAANTAAGVGKKRKRASGDGNFASTATKKARSVRNAKASTRANDTVESEHLPLTGDNDDGDGAPLLPTERNITMTDSTTMRSTHDGEATAQQIAQQQSIYDDLDSLLLNLPNDQQIAEYVPTRISEEQRSRSLVAASNAVMHAPISDAPSTIHQQSPYYSLLLTQQQQQQQPMRQPHVKMQKHTKEQFALSYDATKLIDNYHLFAQQQRVLELLTKDERRMLFPQLRQSYTEQQKRFCTGNVATHRSARDLMRCLMYSDGRNMDRARIETAIRLNDVGIVVHGDSLNRYTEGMLLKYSSVWLKYTTSDTCEWKDHTLTDIERMLVHGEMMDGRACQDCITMLMRLNRQGTCPDIYREKNVDKDVAAAAAVNNDIDDNDCNNEVEEEEKENFPPQTLPQITTMDITPTIVSIDDTAANDVSSTIDQPATNTPIVNNDATVTTTAVVSMSTTAAPTVTNNGVKSNESTTPTTDADNVATAKLSAAGEETAAAVGRSSIRDDINNDNSNMSGRSSSSFSSSSSSSSDSSDEDDFSDDENATRKTTAAKVVADPRTMELKN